MSSHGTYTNNNKIVRAGSGSSPTRHFPRLLPSAADSGGSASQCCHLYWRRTSSCCHLYWCSESTATACAQRHRPWPLDPEPYGPVGAGREGPGLLRVEGHVQHAQLVVQTVALQHLDRQHQGVLQKVAATRERRVSRSREGGGRRGSCASGCLSLQVIDEHITEITENCETEYTQK